MKKILAIGLLMASNLTMALEPSEFYAGAALDNISIAGNSLDGPSFEVFGGYKPDFEFNGFSSAVEFGYIMLADVKFSTPFGTFTQDMGEAYLISGLAIRPINDDFNVYGRLGVLVASQGGGNELKIGLGGEYVINELLTARAEYMTAGDVDILGISIKYSFE